MTGGQLFGAILGFGIFVLAMGLLIKYMADGHLWVSKRSCRDGWCRAWRWDTCTAGHCKYHCDLYCKCAPRGEAGWQPKSIKGGRQ